MTHSHLRLVGLEQHFPHEQAYREKVCGEGAGARLELGLLFDSKNMWEGTHVTSCVIVHDYALLKTPIRGAKMPLID